MEREEREAEKADEGRDPIGLRKVEPSDSQKRERQKMRNIKSWENRKGAEISASFAGSSQTVFGSSGGANFFSRATGTLAAVFMMTSLGYR